jgi:CBS domain-containing protein
LIEVKDWRGDSIENSNDHSGAHEMKAADVMVTNVITVGPDAQVQDVARILLANRISAVPVVDSAGKLLGIISEGDLLRRPETGTERRRSWWLESLTATETLAAEFVRSHSRRVTDVMTRKVVSAKPDTPLGEIAALLEKNRIKRVPIVDGGKVVGIVSRANIVQALASEGRSPATTPDDATLRNKVIAQLKATPRVSPSLLNVIVHGGTVELWGTVDSEAEKDAVRVATEVTPGVREVNDNLTVMPIITAGL